MSNAAQNQVEIEPVTGYTLLSSEYYEDNHITSRNFDAATAVGVRHLGRLPLNGLILELGAGRGRVGEFLHFPPNRVVQTDASKAMLKLEPRETSLLKVLCDARSTPFLDGTFCCICAFLYDPFNTANMYKEIARLLLRGGLFIGTLPAFEWGTTLRQALGLPSNKTRFRMRDGTLIVTDSLLSPDSEIQGWAKAAGLEVSIRLLTLPCGVARISPDIEQTADMLGLHATSLPIVQLVTARKVL